MNINVFLGTVSFVIWSAFSTWLYVNYIKDFNPSQKELAMLSTQKATPNQSKSEKEKSDIVAAISIPINLSRSFTFHKNTADLINTTAIKQYCDSLQTMLSGRNISVTITGYTCDLGKETYNLNLGQDRANFAAESLSKSNMKWMEMNTTSMGESNPQVPNTSELNRIKNRRVTILINSKP